MTRRIRSTHAQRGFTARRLGPSSRRDGLPRPASHRTGLVGHTSGSLGCCLTARTALAVGRPELRCRDDLLPCLSLSAARMTAPSIRRGSRHACPLAGCRRTRGSAGVASVLSTHHPLRSTGVTRLPRYYEVIRLLPRPRATVAAGPTAFADRGRSHGVRYERLRAAAAFSTCPPRLDMGRCHSRQAHPGRTGLTKVRFRSVLHFT